MQQRWWIAVVAVVGIGLAVLLFPRPDTGEDIPDADPTNVDPLDFSDKGDLPPGSAINPKLAGKVRKTIDPDRKLTGPKPGTEELIAKRNKPEAVFAGKIVAPWSGIRYVLMKDGSPEATALSDEINVLMGDLRTLRNDPSAMPWAEVEAKMNTAAEKVAASRFASDPTVTQGLDRYKTILAEYHAAASAPPEGDKTEPQPEPAAPSAPPEE